MDGGTTCGLGETKKHMNLYHIEVWTSFESQIKQLKWEGGDICMPMADSCGGLTENNKIL